MVLVSLLTSMFFSCQNHSRYNLDFRTGDFPDLKWEVYKIPYAAIDSSEMINGKYPLCIKQRPKDTTNIWSTTEPLIIYWSQRFVLPEKKYSKKDSGVIEIKNKCLNISKMDLVLFGFDKSENVVYADSVNINNDSCWRKSRLAFPLKNIQTIRVGMNGLGVGNHSLEQKIWLDRMTVFIKGKNIEQLARPPVINQKPLDKNGVIPLSFDDEQGLDKIEILKDKKIIGLGESAHGCKTIAQSQIQITKYMIEKQQCRLVLFEHDMYAFLNYNLFIQGKLPENKIDEIRDELSTGLYDPVVLSDFLLWLRAYNLQHESKVKIAGIVDYRYDGCYFSLFDYMYAFYNEHTVSDIYPVLSDIYPELKDMNVRKLLQTLNKANNTPRLKEILGEDEYADFLYALNVACSMGVKLDSLKYMPDLKFKSAQDAFVGRDYTMWLTADRYISKLEESEKAVIIAHDGHLNKKTTAFPYIYSMGYYLAGKYHENYAPIGIYVECGEITSAKMFDKNLTVNNLGQPVAGSIENKCSEVHTPYFFCSSDFLPEGDFYYRDIGYAYLPSQSYSNGPLREKIDGFIFINQVEPSESALNYDEVSGRLLYDKLMKNADIKKKIDADNKKL